MAKAIAAENIEKRNNEKHLKTGMAIIENICMAK
jgi:hypothetical protein